MKTLEEYQLAEQLEKIYQKEYRKTISKEKKSIYNKTFTNKQKQLNQKTPKTK